MISKVQRSPTTDSVRATEQVIVSICCQRICLTALHNLRCKTRFLIGSDERRNFTRQASGANNSPSPRLTRRPITSIEH